jgi:hypothetical protein
VKLVLIEWLDSAQPIASWQYLADLPKPTAHLCQTVGHLIEDGEQAKVVALSVAKSGGDDEWDQASGVTVIPSCSVVRMQFLSPEPIEPSRGA